MTRKLYHAGVKMETGFLESAGPVDKGFKLLAFEKAFVADAN